MSKWGMPNLKSKRNSNDVVICGCGRQRAADNMMDLSKMPAHLNLPDFICDACSAALFREGTITLRQVYESHNAPASALDIADHIKNRLYPSPTGGNRNLKKIQRNKNNPIKDIPKKRR